MGGEGAWEVEEIHGQGSARAEKLGAGPANGA
jgi:hypothetical protein